MGFDLRDYQVKAVNAVHDCFDSGEGTALLVLPMAAGKTVIFSFIVKDFVDSGERVLVLAHREELILQAKRTLEGIVDCGVGIEKAGYDRPKASDQVVIASVASLRNRLDSYDEDSFGLIVTDEAHHSMASSYRKIYNYFDKARLLGVTATPFRGDDRSLERVYKSGVTYSYSIDDGINDGYLSPIMAKTLDVTLDVSDLRIINNSHYAEDELDEVLEEAFLGELASKLAKEIKDKKTIIFTPSLKSSQTIMKALAKHKIKCKEINGGTSPDDRKKILDGFANNKFHTIVNCQILTEGFDCPDVNCIVILRPTNSKTLYYQMAGRGLRIAPGKDSFLLLDVKWDTGERFNIMEPADLLLDGWDSGFIDFDDLTLDELLSYLPDDLMYKIDDGDVTLDKIHNEWVIKLNGEDITSTIKDSYNNRSNEKELANKKSSSKDKLRELIRKIIAANCGEIDLKEAIKQGYQELNKELDKEFNSKLSKEIQSTIEEQEFFKDNDTKILALKNIRRRDREQSYELSKRLLKKYEPVKEYFSDYMWQLFAVQSCMVYPYLSIPEYLISIKQYALLAFNPEESTRSNPYFMIDDVKDHDKWFNEFKKKKINPWGGVTSELYFELLHYLSSRIESNMATTKQLNLLMKFGVEGDRSFEHASMLIDMIANNDWQVNDKIINKAKELV